MTAILWLRKDFRPFDHPALSEARYRHGEQLHILWCPADRVELSPPQVALREELAAELAGYLPLQVLEAPESQIIAALLDYATNCGATEIFLTAALSPQMRARDAALTEQARARGITVHAIETALMAPPGSIQTPSGHYKVFTPFYKRWRSECIDEPADPPLPAVPTKAWSEFLEFIADAASRYPLERELPAIPGTSRLGGYLSLGALHPRIMVAKLLRSKLDTESREAYIRQLAFREFYCDLGYQRPETLREDYNPKFSDLAWDSPAAEPKKWEAWQTGRTGYPIVDAGSRQLVATGWMHNRVRMIVASFLVKDLHLPWQLGAEFFAQYLIDYDPAINAHSWQWCAGTGTDASPFFRVFNPQTQGAKFDPQATYIKRWVPELATATPDEIHKLKNLPASYPPPIVDHAAERLEALARYELLKRNS